MKEAKENDTWKPQLSDGTELFTISDYNRELEQTSSSKFFLEMRNILMMTIIPKRLDKKDSDQAAYVKAAIVRVKI